MHGQQIFQFYNNNKKIKSSGLLNVLFLESMNIFKFWWCRIIAPNANCWWWGTKVGGIQQVGEAVPSLQWETLLVGGHFIL